MLPAVHLKRVIDFNKNFKSLLEVLKLIAVSEYHNLERKLKTFDRLNELLAEFFKSVDVQHIRHPLLETGDRPLVVVAVTSDGGLLGGINNQVVSRALDLVLQSNGKLVVIGDRGGLYAQAAGISFTQYPGIVDAQRYGQACEIRDYLMEGVSSGKFGGIKVVYPKAHSFVIHRVEVVTLVPFVLPESFQGTAGAQTQEGGFVKSEGTIFETTPGDLVEYLVFLVMVQQLFEIFGQARLCEQAARYLHLEESCNKIGEMNKKLLLQYFRRRHEVIDANMRELFSARSIFAAD